MAALFGFCCGVEGNTKGPDDVIKQNPTVSQYPASPEPRVASPNAAKDAHRDPSPAPQKASAGARQASPPQDADKETLRSEASATSSAGSSSYDTWTREQKAEAKRIIKDFVKSMVKGKNLHVVLPNGQIRTVLASLSRALDVLKIKAGSNKEAQARAIPLSSIDEILVGTDIGDSEACEGMETPLDELSVTLALSSQECITFRMADIEARDTLVMCLTMFSNEARAKAEA
mmetsp:Transcript_60092/g.176344  ORF Transcript_60092/g.176344 Transcript_60092/m.176344 type:complete len:231 (+) Transcript_60092:75-767(+)